MGIRNLTIGLVQTAVSEDVDQNLAKTRKSIQDAADRGAQVICLQELFATPYFAQKEEASLLELAETIPGRISSYLAHVAKECNITLVGGSIFERTDEGEYFNTCLIFNERGERLAKYRKMHIPHDPYYWEQFYFAPGDLGYAYADITLKHSKIAPLICYDQWFPEPARVLAINGVEIIFYPTAIGWYDQMLQEEPFSAQRWEDAMRAHASMNGIFVAAVNRVGVEEELTFWGASFIADPFGQIIAKASDTDEEVLVAEIDLNRVLESQDGWGFLRNRRPSSYAELILEKGEL
jgi:predicted amidohydrolase